MCAPMAFSQICPMLSMFSCLSLKIGSAWSFPVLLSVFLILFVTTILHVPRTSTGLRVIHGIFLCLLTYSLQQAFFQLCENYHWRAAAAPLLWIQCLSASELILVTNTDFSDIRALGRGSLVIRSIALLWNLRRVGTKWRVACSGVDAGAKDPPKGRFPFILKRLLTTFLAYIVIDAMVSAPTLDSSLVGPRKQTLMHPFDLSLEDIIFRVIGTAAFWASTYLVNLVMSNTVAIFCVATGISSTQNCPPLYGPLSEAYSIRHFWGVTWHQCLRRGLTGHAELITRLTPIFSESKMVSRYMRLSVAFLISGLIHHSSDLAMGIPRAEAGSLRFFLLQPLGIMLEDGVQMLTGSILSTSHLGRVRTRQIIGYAWVMVFLVWTTPTWFYPQQRTGLDPTDLLPFHLIQPVLVHIRNH